MFSAYYNHLNESAFDRVILFLGIVMLVAQTILFLGYVFKTATLDRTAKKWLAWCCMLFELFPLLGLLGTICGLLNTFEGIKVADTGFDVGSMLGDFAPALTTTVSGIIALMVNLAFYLLYILIISIVEEGEVKR